MRQYVKFSAILLTLLMLGVTLAGVSMAEGDGTTDAGKAEVEVEPLNDRIHEETGTTADHGGGDYAYVRFGWDSYFGVLWGTEEYENSIVIVAAHRRYLGSADVYDDNGAKTGNNVLIPVWTVVIQKLEDIFEFNDTNQDGKCNYLRSGNGLFYNDYLLHEPIYKKTSLYTDWERSEIITDGNRTEGWKTYEFSLAARDMPYEAIGDSDSIDDDVENEVVDKMEFTFHLKARLVEVEGVQVPQYKVTVKKNEDKGKGAQNQNQWTILNSERTGVKEVSGKRAFYDIKYDHLIEGWDFDPTNDKDPSLLLEWHAAVGTFIPPKTVEWLSEQFINDIDEDPVADIETEDGPERVSEDSARDYDARPDIAPRRVKDPFVKIGGGWERAGRMTWESNVTVDGKDDKMYAQVQGGVRLTVRGENGGVYKGFAILGGFSYPGGRSIFHDPGMDSAVMIDMAVVTGLGNFELGGNGGRGILVLMMVVGVVAVGGVALKLRSSKKEEKERGDYYDSSYDRSDEEAEYYENGRRSKEEWDEYYDKRR